MNTGKNKNTALLQPKSVFLSVFGFRAFVAYDQKLQELGASRVYTEQEIESQLQTIRRSPSPDDPSALSPTLSNPDELGGRQRRKRRRGIS